MAYDLQHFFYFLLSFSMLNILMIHVPAQAGVLPCRSTP